MRAGPRERRRRWRGGRVKEPRPGRVDAFLPRPVSLARSSPPEPKRLGPIPGDYARQRTNQIRQLMNIYDLG
ncbi:Tetratricopeptide Repeat Protein 16 [Manis pentadactyla]|nr:Tetratricopeptide Repeat Protein 16 [Manis pentadactyla]